MWQGIFTDQPPADTGIAASPEYFTYVNGEGYFSFWHVVFIAAAFCIWAALWFALRRRKNLENLVLASGSAIVLAITAALGIYTACTGIYNFEWYIPLHICNLFAVILPLSLAFKKVRDFCKDYIVFFGIGGGAVAIVTPITSGIYMGHLHPVSIMVWAYHVTIAAMGIYYITSGLYRNFNAFPMLGILTFLIAGSLIMNHFTGSNFLFINPARRVQPLTMFVNIFGEWGVWAVIALVYAFSIALHFGLRWRRRRRERLSENSKALD